MPKVSEIVLFARSRESCRCAACGPNCPNAGGDGEHRRPAVWRCIAAFSRKRPNAIIVRHQTMLRSLGHLSGGNRKNNGCLVLHVVKRRLSVDKLFPIVEERSCEHQVMINEGIILTSIIILPKENTSVRGDRGGESSFKSSGAIQAGFPACFQLVELENKLTSSIA